MRPREPSLPAHPDAADAARARLASDLRQRSRALSRPVLGAFAKVPRHVFVPEVAPDAAYRDEAFVIKCGPDGMPVSSSSQPAMMAIMLDQLRLRPGHRVLEIGTGSGYNAAVMAAVVGPRGKVISIDIDPELVARARASLAAAGYGGVTVMCADGGFGDPGNAPFDRIIVTAGAWDISPAWLGQVAAGGLLVLPLSVRGVQLSVALRRDDDGAGWRSASSWRCGFVRMLGAFAGPEKVIQVGEPDHLVVQVPDGSAVDPRALQAALAGRPAAEQVLPHPEGLAELGDLDLWLTMSASALDRVTVLAAGSWFPPALLLPAGFLVSHGSEADRLGAAALVPAGPGGRDASHGRGSGAVINGFGPGGPALAEHLAGLARRWAELGRPEAQDLQLTVWSADREPASAAAADRSIMLKRPSVFIEVGWPA